MKRRIVISALLLIGLSAMSGGAYAVASRSSANVTRVKGASTVRTIDAPSQAPATSTPSPITNPTPQQPEQVAQPARPQKIDTISISEQNKNKIMSVITSYAEENHRSVLYQTTCFNRIFTNNDLYSDYDALLAYPFTKAYLNGLVYFNGMTCGYSHVPSLPSATSGN